VSMRPSFASFVVLLVSCAAACTGFREVRPGVYRAPQPSDDRLDRMIERQGIRTVVCLRTVTEDSGASARAAAYPGLTFWNVPFSATRLPSPATLLELWDVAVRAERPVLLHCRAGVDRTGLAAALVVLHDTGDLAAARSQLAFLPHGHVGLDAAAMSDVLDRYEAWHGRKPFPDWVRDVYADEYAKSRVLPAAR
jgi:protein tyrosine phosphatase (PTP) superfamily phosphohydrolase (DUF442 family)